MITNIKEEVLKCSRCGNCQYYCPSFTAVRKETHVARGRLQLIGRNLDQPGDYSDSFMRRLDQCLLCGNCSQNCPAGVSVEEIVEAMRGARVERMGPGQALASVAGNIAKEGNITGDGRGNRLLWLENMAADAVKIGKPAEYVYFTGCVPSLYPSSYSIPQTFSALLNKAGLDWTLLGEKENCCSYPLVIGGMRGEAAEAFRENLRLVEELGAKAVVTTCPSCYHLWKEVSHELIPDMPSIEVYHGTQLLAKLVREGAYRLKENDCTVVFHDSCDLGRKSGVYDEPRDILKAIPGVKLKEMKFNRESAFCCGGGGNLEMNDSALSGLVAQQRVAQALDAGADVLVTACQQCKRTLSGGARKMRARIKILDISEFLLNAAIAER